jgi:hypothetical protein
MDQSLARAARAAHARLGLYIHLAAYVLVNLLLAGINLATAPHHLWFVWAPAGWGVGLLLHVGLLAGLPRLRALKVSMIEREMRNQNDTTR